MRALLLAAFVSIISISNAQEYSLSSLQTASKIQDSIKRKESIATIWNSLSELKNIPLIKDDSVVFIYRGRATSVNWMGDFNSWGYDQKMNTIGKRIFGTDIWYLKSSFPKNARFDYKIIIDGKTSILDPENPYQQWSGIGGGSPNSELRMPLWKEDE